MDTLCSADFVGAYVAWWGDDCEYRDVGMVRLAVEGALAVRDHMAVAGEVAAGRRMAMDKVILMSLTFFVSWHYRPLNNLCGLLSLRRSTRDTLKIRCISTDPSMYAT